MNLENSIKGSIEKELENGIIEKVIAKQLEKCVENAVSDMFGYGGEVKSVIQEKIKSVMIPYLENYDYSEYITKLDSVLVDVLKSSTLENKAILENFKELIENDKDLKEVKITDIFDEWNKYCEENINRDNLEFDCGNTYVETSFFCEEVNNSWSSYKTYMVTFECEEDEELKFEFSMQRWGEGSSKNYTGNYKAIADLNSLRHLSSFEVFMMKVSQGYENIILDEENGTDGVHIEQEE